MKALHFGAGNIGRGLIGDLLNRSNYEITFVDMDRDIVKQLNTNHSYKIEYIGQKEIRKVDKVSALNIEDDLDKIILAFKDVDLITTSVGVNNLKHIAKIIKLGVLERNRPINILANENAFLASNTLKNEVLKLCNDKEKEVISNYGLFVNTAIDRISTSRIDGSELIASVEPYYEWVIERKNLETDIAKSLNLATIVDNIIPFIERKLFIINSCHVTFAYIGNLFNYTTIQEAAADKRILKFAKDYLNEVKRYFISEYDMDENDLDEFIKKTIERQSDKNSKDLIIRVGKDPIRKLGHEERIIGPLVGLEKYKLPNEHSKKLAAVAYMYVNEGDMEAEEIQRLISQEGFKPSLKKISNIDNNLADQIYEYYKNFKIDKENIFIQ